MPVSELHGVSSTRPEWKNWARADEITHWSPLKPPSVRGEECAHSPAVGDAVVQHRMLEGRRAPARAKARAETPCGGKKWRQQNFNTFSLAFETFSTIFVVNGVITRCFRLSGVYLGPFACYGRSQALVSARLGWRCAFGVRVLVVDWSLFERNYVRCKLKQFKWIQTFFVNSF